MKKSKNQPQSVSQYFSIVSANRQQENDQYQSFLRQPLYQQAMNIEQQAYHQILFGFYQFKQKPDSIGSIIQIPKQKKVSGDIDEIDRKIKQNEQMLRQAKRQMLIHKRQQQEAFKLEHQIKMQQNNQKTRQWAQKQKVYEKRRLQLIQKRQKQIEQSLQLEKQQKQRLKQQQIQQRKSNLQERLKSLQQNRQRRKQLYQQTVQLTKRIPQPKYKQIQKVYEKYLEQQKFQKLIAKKNVKIAKEVNFDLIKQHEKQYLEKVEERMKQKGYSSLKSMKKQNKQLQQSRFKTLLKRSDQQIEEERQKFQRRLSYQSRLSEIQIQTDDAKKIKIQIARDKARNPLKYNFLKQKNLNDYQIFMEFKDFALDIDRNQLGKQYLKEARKIGEQSRIRKSQSVTAISKINKRNNAMTEQKYKNYLPQIKTKRLANQQSMNNLLTPKDIEDAVNKINNKQKAFQKISKSLKKYDESILDKKLQLKSLNMISSTIKKQRQIDELYMKSLKAKLACLEISQN